MEPLDVLFFLPKTIGRMGQNPNFLLCCGLKKIARHGDFFFQKMMFFFGLLHSVGSERAQATGFTGFSGSSWPSGLDHIMTP